MKTADFVHIWERRVRPEPLEQFREHCGPEASWINLFPQADRYVTTVLYEDPIDDQRFVIVDQWASEPGFRAFRERFSAAFEELDGIGEMLIVSERRIGHFAPPAHR